MKTQESWSKNTSLSGPFADRQKTFSRSRSLSISVYGYISEIADEELKVRIVFDKRELNELYKNYYFVLAITADEFISKYGSIDSFKELIKSNKFLVKLTSNSNDLKNGKVHILSEKSFVYDDNHSNESYSLTAILHGFPKPESNFIVIKSSYKKEDLSSIKLSKSKINISVDGNKFVEVTETGTTISGPVNFQTNPSQITFGGMVALPDFYRGMIPSTVTTPNPLYLPVIPLEFLKTIKDISSLFTSLML